MDEKSYQDNCKELYDTLNPIVSKYGTNVVGGVLSKIMVAVAIQQPNPDEALECLKQLISTDYEIWKKSL